MKKINLNLAAVQGVEILSKQQLKSIVGGADGATGPEYCGKFNKGYILCASGPVYTQCCTTLAEAAAYCRNDGPYTCDMGTPPVE